MTFDFKAFDTKTSPQTQVGTTLRRRPAAHPPSNHKGNTIAFQHASPTSIPTPSRPRNATKTFDLQTFDTTPTIQVIPESALEISTYFTVRN
ncbi:hypothetical protein ACFPK9_13035 [Rubritalea spongiae]